MVPVSISLLLFATQLLAVQSAYQLPISKENLSDKLEEFVTELMSCRKLAGINIGIVHEKETVLTKVFGKTSLETNANVTEDTLFGIASLSKAFTSALLGKVLSLSDKGYTWDTKVRTILGDKFFFYDELRTEYATLRDLLTHRMGFPSYNSMRHQSGLDRAALVSKIRFLKPTLTYRGSYKYNNLMYGLLTHVTEVLGGDTWEHLMRKHIFEPLGMTSSDFTHLMDLTRTDLATSYQVDYDGTFRAISPQYHSYWGKIGGSGSIVSNVIDMTKWVKMLLNDGQSEDGTQVIPSDVIQEVHTEFESVPISSADRAYMRPEAPVSYTHDGYGLAWRIGYYRGWPTIHHTGTSLGYLAQLTLVPDLDIGVISSLTGDDPGFTSRRHIHLHTLDLLMGEVPWINVTSACTMTQGGKFRSEKTQNKAKIAASVDLSKYEGTFGNFLFGNVTYYIKDSKLMMAYGDLGIWEMHPNNDNIHSFDAVGTDVVWNWGFWDIVFDYTKEGSTGALDTVTIYSMERTNPPVFVRGQMMDEAPAPPELACAPDVGEVAKAGRMNPNIWLLIIWLIGNLLQ